jgi:tRNA/tmRNA/rRNA uracil-C5-methylase (TrmA/RlmC/RlmD family)
MRREGRTVGRDENVGEILELEVGPYAHGGHCVARHDGRVIFVRHTLPGERVKARVTEGGAKFWRADAIDVHQASPDRVPAAFAEAGPGGVGGGELSHVSLEGQHRWKAAVIREQMKRLARIDIDVDVQAAPGDKEMGGLGYRTRFDLVADGQGRAGMRRHRSHAVVPLKTMPLASSHALALADKERVFERTWAPGAQIEVIAPACGSSPLLLVDSVPWHNGRADHRPNTRQSVSEEVSVAGQLHQYRVAAAGFWQTHREAPGVLADAVLGALGDVGGADILELYSGAGMFSLPLAAAVGDTGTVTTIESDERAVRDARRNAHHLPSVQLKSGDVRRVLEADGELAVARAFDAVVLDPPRSGAGRAVIDAIATRNPSRVIYIACDPAALARDVGYLAEHGYSLTGLSAHDLFPHTHHVECVATLERG